MHEIGQSRRFVGRLLKPLLKTFLPLIKHLLKTLAKSVLLPLGLTAAASATSAAVHKKMFGLGRPSDLASRTTTLNISNEEMNVIIKIIRSLE